MKQLHRFPNRTDRQKLLWVTDMGHPRIQISPNLWLPVLKGLGFGLR